ncbi:hypothetical protein H1S01_04615 [Heliobacterium chlorum]|uniref:Uncharacterized protein n=1 Tax=Heliobacterium chlorum TaxID=2698 RepID=A0ABR7SZ29_HELCL|nr:hypothetical protein [Heliobacterium chlorum]MBC9783794.1 hypothetical protein [Heliobacterium chlorum]
MKFDAGITSMHPELFCSDFPLELFESLFTRHFTGDWGSVSPEVWTSNEQAITHGGELVSLYTIPNGRIIKIVTNTQRSGTTAFYV